MANEFKIKNGLITPNIFSSGDTNTNSLSIQGVQIINSDGDWVGSPTNLQGLQGIQGIAGVSDWIRKTNNYTLINKDQIIADTSGGSFTLTLPLNPIEGDSIKMVDGANWNINNLIINSNGNTIEGNNDNLTLDINDVFVEFIYDGSTWHVFTSIGQQGTQGIQGIQGIQGTQGIQGNNGPSTLINAESDTSTTSLYLTMVGATGANQTIKANSSLIYNASTGVLNATSFNSTSDLNKKENITPILNALEKVLALNGVEFVWKDSKRKDLGLIAQEVEQIIPQIVTEIDGIKTIAYGNIVGLLIQAIKEQQIIINNIINYSNLTY